MATYGALIKAIEYGVKSIVVGGIKGRDISKLLGYEIGVAITGEEAIDLSRIVTEGFGEMRARASSGQRLSFHTISRRAGPSWMSRS